MSINPIFSILVPTKNRIVNISNLLQSLETNTSEKGLQNNSIEVVFYLDKTDVCSIDFIEKCKALCTFKLSYCTSDEKILFSDMWNKAFEKSTGDYLMLCGDDVEFNTKNWNEMVLAAFNQIPDKIAYITVKDGYQNGAMGVHGFVSRKWVELIGFFTPPYFDYWYADTWLDEVSKMIGRYVYLENVEVIHYHPATANSRGSDDVYAENNSKITPELIASYENRKSERMENAAKLQLYIDNFSEQFEAFPTKEPTKKLSILICSIFSRQNKFNKLMEELNRQLKPFKNKVEILYYIDDAIIPIGRKRNSLLERSNGEYVVFIDDDDIVNENYIELILLALEENPNVDCIGFSGKIFYANEWYNFYNSIKNDSQIIDIYQEEKRILDNISHINPIKRSIATKFRFPEKFWGEDAGWLVNVRSLLKTEFFLNPIMYIYTPSKEDDVKRNLDLKNN